MITDPLTGVYSRVTLEKRLHEEIERAQRYDLPFSIILLDLDHYKSINDAFGHRRGDQILIEVVDRMRAMIRRADIFFRYGGDEFLLLLPNTPKSQATQMAERLLESVSSKPFGAQPQITVSLSMGVASVPQDANSAEALFEKADQRHYEAKRRGRGRVIAEDFEKPSLLPFDDGSRLIERDEALVTLHHFLKVLPEKRRGVFVITGPSGSGRTRFLSEVSKVARLQGFEVIAIHGSPAIKNRTFGNLAEACKAWEILPQPSMGVEIFAQGLQRLVIEKGRSGLLFTVDDLPDTDWATQDLLRHLMFSNEPPILLALAYTADLKNAQRAFPPLRSLQELVEFGPLSRRGFHIRMRTILHWEPPEPFIDWLYQETGGLPALLQKGLLDLVHRGILEKHEEKWAFKSDYTTDRLKERLGFQPVPYPNNLPAAATDFVGRELEIQTAKELLSSNRLLTLIGPGGVGKTRLALQVAAELTEEFPHGVWWVSLASVASPDFLVSTIAEALNFSFYNREDPDTQLFNFLREKQMLLVLDNFEHLTLGAEFLGDILFHASQIKIMVTSRERLNLRGESILELSGMAFPPLEATDRLEGYSAIQLFVQSARRTNPDFTLSEECKSCVIRICQLLEGLPLGIELSAAWMRVLSCEEVVEEIEKNLDFLVSPLRDLPERHRSLRAVFEHSWKLLTEEERRVLRQISVFQGGFRREAAISVVGATLAHITNLMDKSLLRKNGERYEMHEILHQYAAEKLQQHPEENQQISELHSCYYANFLAGLREHLKDQRQKQALQSIGEEIENIRAGWRYAIEHSGIEEIKISLESLYTFYEIRGFFREGEQVLQGVMGMLESTLEEERGNRGNPVLLEKVRLRYGALHFRQSHYEQARQLLEQSLESLRTMDQPLELALGLNKLSSLSVELGQYDRARKLSQESLEIYQRQGDTRGIGELFNQLGNISYQIGDYQKAEHYHRESLRLFRDMNSPWELANTLISLGNVESELGDNLQAKQYYQEALAICEEIDAKSGMAATLNNIGDIARELGDYAEARENLMRSKDLYRLVGDRYGMWVVLINLGDVAYRLGDYEEADVLLQQSRNFCEETGNRQGLAQTMAILGNVASARGEFLTSKELLHQALRLSVEHRALPLVLETMIDIAILLNRSGQKARAYELLSFTLNHPATMKGKREEAEALRNEIAAELRDDIIRQAQEKGRLRPMDEVVEEILTNHVYSPLENF